MRLPLTVLVALIAGAAQAQDYFPLADGDTWTYGFVLRPPDAPADTSRAAPVTVSERVTVRDTAYVVIDFPVVPSDTLRTDAEGRVWGRVHGRDVLLFDVTRADGETYAPGFGTGAPGEYGVTVRRPETVRVPGGTYPGAVTFSFDVPGLLDDEFSVSLAPGVGLVAAYGAHDLGELFEATVGGRVVTDAESAPLAVPVEAFPNPFTSSLTVALPAERWRRVTVTDALGRLVATLDASACGAGCEVRWDAADAAPGLYLVRAEGDRQRVVVPVVRSR